MCACMCVYLYIYMFIKSSKNIKNNKTFICLRRTNILKKRIQKIWKNIYIFQFICVKILYKNPFTRTTYRFVNLIIFAHFFIFNLIEKKFQLIRFSRNRKEIKRKINKANILRCERIKKKNTKKGKGRKGFEARSIFIERVSRGIKSDGDNVTRTPLDESIIKLITINLRYPNARDSTWLAVFHAPVNYTRL